MRDTSHPGNNKTATAAPALYIFGQSHSCSLLPPQGFRPEAKSRGGTLVTRAYIRTVLTVQIYSQYTRKISICSNWGREESVGNDDVSIVLLFYFVTFIGQSYFDTLLRYAVTFCGPVVLKVMDQKTLVKRRGGYKVRLTVYM